MLQTSYILIDLSLCLCDDQIKCANFTLDEIFKTIIKQIRQVCDARLNVPILGLKSPFNNTDNKTYISRLLLSREYGRSWSNLSITSYICFSKHLRAYFISPNQFTEKRPGDMKTEVELIQLGAAGGRGEWLLKGMTFVSGTMKCGIR